MGAVPVERLSRWEIFLRVSRTAEVRYEATIRNRGPKQRDC